MGDSDASSDPEDFEYIPEGDGGRSESEQSVAGEEEEEEEEERAVSTSSITTRSSQRTSTITRTSRRHRRPVKNIIGHEDVEKREGEDEEEEEEERVENKQQREKSRVDDLWESFKQDSAARLRKPYPVKNSDQTPSDTSKEKGANVETAKTVKVRKTYDFAGDEVVVEQEVSADSVEAKQLVSEQDITSATATVSDPQPTTSSSSSSSVTGVGAGAASGPLPSGKKRSGISSVLQSLAKKPKMSTLEKSQLDWNRFKAEEGLEHELAKQRKDGYLERQEFLQRTDWRQYELEREERLKKFNRLH